jgi:biopolymer transport protein ExbB/TolQ
MKFYGPALAVVLAVLLGALFVARGLTTQYAPDLTTAMTFLEAHAVQKLVMMTCLQAGGVAILLTFFGAIAAMISRTPGRGLETALRLIAALTLALGLLGGVYGEMNTRLAIAASHTTDFAVTAPSRIESLLAVEIGAFAGIVALAGAALVHFIAGRKKLTAA